MLFKAMNVRDIHVYFCVYLHMFQGSLSMFISQLFVLISYSTSWLLRLWQSGCNSANNNNHISIFFVHQFAVYPHPPVRGMRSVYDYTVYDDGSRDNAKNKSSSGGNCSSGCGGSWSDTETTSDEIPKW